MRDAVTIDFRAFDKGSVWLLEPLTDAAKAWVDEHLPSDAQWLGNAVGIEPRYIEAILAGLEEDGLVPWVVLK